MYGVKPADYIDCNVTFRNSSPYGDQLRDAGTFNGVYKAHASRDFSRSGTNASGIKGTYYKKFPGTVVRYPVTVRNGPRLPYKVWSKKLQKWVYAREPITIWRTKRIRTKIPFPKGLDLPANRLSYSGNIVSYFGGDDGQGNGKFSGYHYQPGYSRHYEGALFAPFLLNGGWSNLSPNPQNYMTGLPSDDIMSSFPELTEKALTKLYSDVKDQKVNFAQALAERAQTAGMISDLVGRLVRAVKAARRGNLSKAAKTLFPGSSKELANDHLIVQYGLRPLVSDIQGCVELLSAQNGDLVFDVIVRRTKKFPHEVIYEGTGLAGAVVTKVTRSGKATVIYKARLRVTNPAERWASTTGLSDGLLLAYELTAYSFVLDWLLPVGDYLKNRSAFDGLQIDSLHKTQFAVEYVTFTREFRTVRDNDGYLYTARAPAGFVNKRVSCNREVITTNLPELPLPSFKDPTSYMHVANAIALLTQSVRK